MSLPTNKEPSRPVPTRPQVPVSRTSYSIPTRAVIASYDIRPHSSGHGSSVISPKNELLSGLLAEKRAARDKEVRARRFASLDDRACVTSPIRKRSIEEDMVERAEEEERRKPREMGMREMDKVSSSKRPDHGVTFPLICSQYIDRLRKENFDLKLEVHFCRQKLNQYQARIEIAQRREEENKQLQDELDEAEEMKKKFMEQLDNRESALSEAIAFICELEGKVHELETYIPGGPAPDPGTRVDSPSTPRHSLSQTLAVDVPDRSSSRKGTGSAESARFSQLPKSAPRSERSRRLFDSALKARDSTATLRGSYYTKAERSTTTFSIFSKTTEDNDDEPSVYHDDISQLSMLSESDLRSVYGSPSRRSTRMSSDPLPAELPPTESFPVPPSSEHAAEIASPQSRRPSTHTSNIEHGESTSTRPNLERTTSRRSGRSTRNIRPPSQISADTPQTPTKPRNTYQTHSSPPVRDNAASMPPSSNDLSVAHYRRERQQKPSPIFPPQIYNQYNLPPTPETMSRSSEEHSRTGLNSRGQLSATDSTSLHMHSTHSSAESATLVNSGSVASRLQSFDSATTAPKANPRLRRTSNFRLKVPKMGNGTQQRLSKEAAGSGEGGFLNPGMRTDSAQTSSPHSHAQISTQVKRRSLTDRIFRRNSISSTGSKAAKPFF